MSVRPSGGRGYADRVIQPTPPGPAGDGDPIVALAERIARQAHQGQVDKAGRPYAHHPSRVAAACADDPQAAAAAWLHDVVEDTDWGLAELAAAGLPSAVLDAVALLTRAPDQDPDAYYAAIRGNRLALRVKLADLADNGDPNRLAALDEPTRIRLQRKYAHARAQLTQGDPQP